MFLTIIVFILILGLLIFVHEFGHFILAKRAGIRVEEFGFGFPPRIFGIRKGETLYSLNLLPIGGFVKIYGEDGKTASPTKKDKARAFYSKPISTRAGILVAGVTMNLVLAAFLLSIGYWLGLPAVVDDQTTDLIGSRVQITQVAFDSPAEKAEIKMGDIIKQLTINNKQLTINTVGEMQEFVEAHQGEEIIVVIQRGDEVLEKTLVPRVSPPENEGPLGVALARTAIVSYPWYRALIMGITSTVNLTWFIIVALGGLLWQLLMTGKLAIEIAGPVGIFNLTGQAAQLGFIYILQLTALISINLAIINILPFPALDGGRLLFLFIEKIKGSPVSQKIEKIAHTAGFVILILLMVAVTWRDVVRLF
ncbi:MAG: RIP metalloprotease RseP [Candidatus Portnoybacteria bacterium]|nr:RIP metalloprotease RseP [Candidatus Portnoybacteria bacterium]